MLIESPPNNFIVFEGVDGTGKTTLANLLTQYYQILNEYIYSGSFPGLEDQTLGKLVYKIHHSELPHLLRPEDVAPPALQFMHVAAHIHTITTKIVPALQSGGCVILDRYWWSTYAYSRLHLPAKKVWPLINAERAFLSDVSPPIIIYLSREQTLKPDEISPSHHKSLNEYYGEAIEEQRKRGVNVHIIDNNKSLDSTWEKLLAVLKLPYIDIGFEPSAEKYYVKNVVPVLYPS